MDPQLLNLLLVLSVAGVCWKSAPVFVLWWRARRSRIPVGLLTVWGLYFRNLPVETILDAQMAARRAGVAIELREMVAHLRAGGDLLVVVRAYIETLRAGTEIDFSRVCELELETEE